MPEQGSEGVVSSTAVWHEVPQQEADSTTTGSLPQQLDPLAPLITQQHSGIATARSSATIR